MKKRFYITLLTLFVVITAASYLLHTNMPRFDFTTLLVGNILIAALSIGVYEMVSRQLNGRPAAFIRGVMGATFLKLMVCIIAMLVYVVLNRTTLYKPTVFILFGMYALYSIAETTALSKITRTNKHDITGEKTPVN